MNEVMTPPAPQTAIPQEAPPAPQAAAPTEEEMPTTGTEEGSNVTPEEQKAFDSVVLAGMEVVYSDETHEKIMEAVKTVKDPSTALAKVTSAIIIEIDQQSKGQIPETVILPAAMEILNILAEVVNEAGILDVNEGIIGRAVQQIMVSLMESYGTNEQDVASLVGNFDEKTIDMIGKQQKSTAESWAGQKDEKAGPSGQPPAPTGQPPNSVEQPGGLMGGRAR